MSKKSNGANGGFPSGFEQSKKFGRFIGTSEAMKKVYNKVEKLAPTNTPVFIEGESGTGKEICAQMLHSYSDRHAQPFIALNCAALPKDLIESALYGHMKGAFTGATHSRDGAITKTQGGTLFLDEIGDLPLDLQPKLLRFCQDFSYSKLGADTILKANIRLISASNKNMKDQIQKKLFREDLYYRLYVAPIKMPALRHHKNDIIDIAYYFLERYAKIENKNISEFSENAEKLLLHYDWPGNVRELENIIRQIISLENAPVILASMLPNRLSEQIEQIVSKSKTETAHDTNVPLWKIEKHAIQDAIALMRGDIPKAAAMLDIAPSTIYRKIKLWESK